MNTKAPLQNIAKLKLAAGELVLCLSIRQMRTVESAMITQACGFDVIIIDQEHAPISRELSSSICVAALGVGLTPMVRIGSHSAHDIGAALDGGALGVLVPHINNAAEAKAAVDHSKYAPIGHRSVAALSPVMRYQPPALAESLKQQNDAIFVGLLIETPEGVDNAEEIAAIPGVDALIIGSVDLSVEFGEPGRFEDATMQSAYAKVAAACRKHDKQFAVAGGNREQQAKHIAMGARLMMGGMDVNYMINAARSEVAAIRALLPAK